MKNSTTWTIWSIASVAVWACLVSAVTATILGSVTGCNPALPAAHRAVLESAKRGSAPFRTAIGEDRDEASQQVSYSRIFGGVSLTMRPLGLCELADTVMEQAGEYRVVSLTGVTDADATPGVGAHTLIGLQLLGGWTEGAPTFAVARTPGGPTKDGGTAGWLFEMSVGDEVGVLLFHHKNNLDYYGVHPQGLWKKTKSGGWSNGFLFTQVSVNSVQLKENLRLVTSKSGAGCPVDFLPDCCSATLDPAGSSAY